MAFSDPIVGANDTLIRNAIQSEGFQTGVSGWRIERDGDAEFNDVDVRGTVDVGTTNGHVIIDASTEPIESVTRGVIRFTEDDNAAFVNQGLIAGGKNSDNEGYLLLHPPQYSGDPDTYPAAAAIVRTSSEGDSDLTSGYFTGGSYSQYSEFVSKPAVMASGSWVNFTDAQWPWIDTPVPPSGILTVTISGEGNNTNSATANLYFGYEISNAGTGAVYLSPEARFAAKLNCWGNAANAAGYNRYDRGATGSLPAPGTIVRIKAAWFISSGNAGTVSMSIGLLNVTPGIYPYP
jgi:hypothetical protein